MNQLKLEIIESLYQKVFDGDYSQETIKELIKLENEADEEKGSVEKWHLPHEAAERPIEYDENQRSTEKLVAVVKSKKLLKNSAKIICGYLVVKRGKHRFEGFRYTVEDILMYRLVRKKQQPSHVKENTAQQTEGGAG